VDDRQKRAIFDGKLDKLYDSGEMRFFVWYLVGRLYTEKDYDWWIDCIDYFNGTMKI